MDRDLLKYQIGLTLIKGIGVNLAKNLIAYVGSVEGVFKENKRSLMKIPGIGITLANEITKTSVLERAEKEILFIEKHKIQTSFFLDKLYPYRLKECFDAPIMLYYKGNQTLSNRKMLAVVGTRNMTENGKEVCKELIKGVHEKLTDITLVSGLAYGVDICSHKVATELDMQNIAVLAHGLDRIYPSLHKDVARKIISNGALVTEYISGMNPDRPNFVKRNRIIAGLCDAIVIVESNQRGGALITAEYANSYNRDVLAIPGRFNDTYSKGCNNLIKYNKAGLITCADDLIRAMNWEVEKKSETNDNTVQLRLFNDLSVEEQQILSELRKYSDGINVNELTILLKIPYSKLSALLLDMEFKSLVKCLPGGVYKIKN